jgi:hypothetical protein
MVMVVIQLVVSKLVMNAMEEPHLVVILVMIYVEMGSFMVQYHLHTETMETLKMVMDVTQYAKLNQTMSDQEAQSLLEIPE